jgi:hypothetical protein
MGWAIERVSDSVKPQCNCIEIIIRTKAGFYKLNKAMLIRSGISS